MTSGTPELQTSPIAYDVDDLVALSRLVGRSPRQLLSVAAGAALILIIFTMVMEAWALAGFIDWASIIVMLVVSATVLVWSNRRFRAWAWLKIASRSPLAGRHSYAISPGALRISSPKSSSEVKWTAFTDVRRVGERLFLFVSARQAFIVPSRGFGANEDFESFAEAALQYWERGFRL